MVPDGGALFDRTPPFSPEAETVVLAAMMIDAKAIPTVMALVREADFYREPNRRIFRAALGLYEANSVVDVVTIGDRLKSTGEMEAAGGYDYLAALVGAVPTSANVGYHAKIVRQKAALRRVVEGASSVIRAVYDGGEDVEAVVSAEIERLARSTEGFTSSDFRWIKDSLWSTFETIEKLQETAKAGGVLGLPTGFYDLDRKVCGLQLGELSIVAARPSQGKTSWAMNVVANAAIAHQIPCGVASLEMTTESLTMRMLCAEGRIDMQRLRQGRLSQEDHQRLAAAAGHVNSAPIWIDDDPVGRLTELGAKASRLAQKTGAKLLVVDYIQLMDGTGEDSRRLEVEAISRGMKGLARRLNIHVMLLSQLSRGPEARTNHRPMLSDLRECVPVDEWISTPDGPRQMRDRPALVSTVSDGGARTAECLYVPKRYNTVYEVRTAFGSLRATARHLVLTGTGWKQVRDLRPGLDVIAAPRSVPHSSRGYQPHGRLLGWLLGNGGLSGTPSLIYRRELDADVKAAVKPFGIAVRYRKTQKSPNVFDTYLSRGTESGSAPNPLMEWIRSLGLEGRTCYDKVIPQAYLGSDDMTHRALLRGLWETDGTVTGGAAKYATVSEPMARQVAWLLLTQGVRSTVTAETAGQGARLWTVRAAVEDNAAMRAILGDGARFGALKDPDPRRVDPCPEVFVRLLHELGCGRRLQRRRDGSFKAIAKEELRELARDIVGASSIMESPYMQMKGVGWSRIMSVEKQPREVRVADLQVPGTHNFVANGLVVHNSGSLEQDADLVLFIYRPEMYVQDGDTEKAKNQAREARERLEGVTELIVAKQRNGPTGTIPLFFQKAFTRFDSVARDPQFSALTEP